MVGVTSEAKNSRSVIGYFIFKKHLQLSKTIISFTIQNKNNMKNLIILLSLCASFVACSKSNVSPVSTGTVQTLVTDTTGLDTTTASAPTDGSGVTIQTSIATYSAGAFMLTATYTGGNNKTNLYWQVFMNGNWINTDAAPIGDNNQAAFASVNKNLSFRVLVINRVSGNTYYSWLVATKK